jgi:hypothetical protein
MDVNIGLACIAFVIIIYSAWIVGGQQRTIDRLTDKLMSKDYSEYKRNNHITIDDSKPQRKPVSFYDDPSIEIDENEH